MDNYVYRDRKMMKWIPFNALLEQSDYLTDLLTGRERIEKPTLSPDQEADLNYQLETAYICQLPVVVTYYEDGDLKEIEGLITRTDQYRHQIFIDNEPIAAQLIIEIVQK